MNNIEGWQYNEFKQVGKDYSQLREVEIYDSSHAEFRDVAGENLSILTQLSVDRDTVLIDFGAGTGAFALQASTLCAHVYAVDISPAMLAAARKKAEEADISNISFCHAGFLTYAHDNPPVDAIASSLAFHHLPDFWKGIALKRLYRLLKPGGLFYLHDVIIEENNAIENINALIEHQTQIGGDFLREDAECHFREEFSTYDWIIDELLTRAGFQICNKTIENGLLCSYLCLKPAE